MPPGHGKSTLVSKAFPAWYLGRFPDHKIGLASYEGDFAAWWGRQARDILTVYGSDIFGVKVDTSRQRSDWWELAGRRGAMYCVGVGGPLTGKRLNGLIMEDPIKNDQEANSETVREQKWNWYTSTAYTRLEPAAWIILVMTRWHEDDIAGRIQQQEKEGEGEKWDVIDFPAIAEREDVLGRKPGEALWPSRFSLEHLKQARKVVGKYWWCTPAETPILMSDWSCKPISDVRPGDTVVGFTQQRPGKKRRLVRSVVHSTSVTREVVCDLQMASGRQVRCTREHKWFKGRWTKGRKLYGRAEVGNKLCFACETEDEATPEERELWAYLAGMVDGEGHIRRSVLVVAQGTGKGLPVFENVIDVCNRLGLSFVVKELARLAPGWQNIGQLIIHDVGTVYRKLLRFTRIGKREQLERELMGGAGRCQRGPDEVVAIEPGKVEDVYALETETGNYVAWGYLSSNSAMYQQHPQPAGGDVVQREWFRYFEYNDRGAVVVDGEELSLPRFRYATVDLATSLKQEGHYTVVSVWTRFLGKDRTKDKILLLDVVRVKIGGHQLIPMLESVCKKWRIGRMGIEKRGMQLALIQQAQAAGLPVRELVPDGDKMSCFLAAAPFFERGQVYFLKGATWLDELEYELLAFPRAKFDDQVDTVSWGVAYMSMGSVMPTKRKPPRRRGVVNHLLGDIRSPRDSSPRERYNPETKEITVTWDEDD